MKWCCSTFKVKYEKAGQSGPAIIVYQDSKGQPQFVIQHRAVDQGLEASVRAEIPALVVSDMYIDYCPWCGRDLDKVYGKVAGALFRPNLKIETPA